MVNQIEKVCFTCGLLAGNSGEGYHYACETISTYFETSGTWKSPRYEILQPDRGRSHGRGVAAGTRGAGRSRGRIIEEDI